jgi:hypothetical protein
LFDPEGLEFLSSCQNPFDSPLQIVRRSWLASNPSLSPSWTLWCSPLYTLFNPPRATASRFRESFSRRCGHQIPSLSISLDVAPFRLVTCEPTHRRVVYPSVCPTLSSISIAAVRSGAFGSTFLLGSDIAVPTPTFSSRRFHKWRVYWRR